MRDYIPENPRGLRCWICYRILLAEGYPPAVARAEALFRHPKAQEYYDLSCLRSAVSEAIASTKSSASAGASSSSTILSEAASSAGGKSSSGGVMAHADPT